jgi:hypothetical protein
MNNEPWMETATPGKFPIFQQMIFPIIESLIKKPEYTNHAFLKKWKHLKKIPNIPMTADITWRNIKVLLGINNLHQYQDFLAQCPALNTVVVLRSSATTKSGFDYGVIPTSTPSADTVILDHENPTSGLDDGSYVLDVMLHQDSGSGSVITDPANQVLTSEEDHPSTPKQMNVLQTRVSVGHTEENDGSITTRGTAETNAPAAVSAPVVTEEASGFCLVHYRLSSVVTDGMKKETAKKSPFYLKWQKATFAGLDELMQWDRDAQIFKLLELRDYITFMNECLDVHESFELKWDFFTNTI